MLQLKIVKGPGGVGTTRQLTPGKSCVIGRAETADFRIASGGISKNHCRVTPIPGSRAEVEDMGSSNGTFINGLLVKKGVLKPGDTLTVAEFVLTLGVEAPRPMAPASTGFDGGTPAFSVPTETVAEPQTIGEKALRWIDVNINPWADELSGRFDMRVLVAAFFMIWSLLIILLTISPFAGRSNTKIREESVQVAKLYARQLVRINQQKIIDQNYRDLVTELDSVKGQTPGIMNAQILDVAKGQIIAPIEQIGRNLPNGEAQIAATKETEFVQFDSSGTAWVSAPIKVGSSQGDITKAVVFVEFNAIEGEFTLANLLDAAVTSLLFALIVSGLLFIFLYRWIEGSILTLVARFDEAMKASTTDVTTTVKWPALQQLADLASSALAKASGGQAAAGAADTQWALACVSTNPLPAAAFDANLVVIAWNEGMEKVIGIRAAMAMGADISGASRDVSFEAAVRELSQSTTATPWAPADRKLEFSGRFYKFNMLTGSGAHYVTITPLEE